MCETLSNHERGYSLSTWDCVASAATLFSGAPYAMRHYELSESAPEYRLGHRLIALIEFIPVIGALAVLIELVIVCVFNYFSKPREEEEAAFALLPLDCRDQRLEEELWVSSGEEMPRRVLSVEEISERYSSYYTGVGETWIGNFEQIEKIISVNDEPAGMISEMNRLKLDRFVHLEDWAGHENELIADLRRGVEVLHEVFNAFGAAEASRLVDKTSHPCFNGIVTHLQETLEGVETLFSVNMDPNHSPKKRINEYIRVYRNEKARGILTREGREITKNNIESVLVAGALDQSMNRDEILNWCKQNGYIGPSSTYVKLSRCSPCLLYESSAALLVEQILIRSCLGE